MRLAIFGATGGTGRNLVEQALEHGDELTVLARNPAKLARTDVRLRVVQGDVRDVVVVRQTVAGAEAVISVLGPRRGAGPRVLAAGMRNITEAMLEAGVRRLVVLSITAVRDTEDRVGCQNYAATRYSCSSPPSRSRLCRRAVTWPGRASSGAVAHAFGARWPRARWGLCSL